MPLFVDPVLGELRPADMPAAWQAHIAIGDQALGFIIAGRNGPDARLIEHARDIIQTFPAFQQTISTFLSVEAFRATSPELREEIARLTVEDVCLLWPDRPNDGMINFKGPDEFKNWRCDYIDRSPVNLGYDS